MHGPALVGCSGSASAAGVAPVGQRSISAGPAPAPTPPRGRQYRAPSNVPMPARRECLVAANAERSDRTAMRPPPAAAAEPIARTPSWMAAPVPPRQPPVTRPHAAPGRRYDPPPERRTRRGRRTSRSTSEQRPVRPLTRAAARPHSASAMKFLGLSFLAGLVSALGFAPLGLWPLTLARLRRPALADRDGAVAALARWRGAGGSGSGSSCSGSTGSPPPSPIRRRCRPGSAGSRWCCCRSTSPSIRPPPRASPGAGARQPGRAGPDPRRRLDRHRMAARRRCSPASPGTRSASS